jgi:hypothetical protein
LKVSFSLICLILFMYLLMFDCVDICWCHSSRRGEWSYWLCPLNRIQTSHQWTQGTSNRIGSLP